MAFQDNNNQTGLASFGKRMADTKDIRLLKADEYSLITLDNFV